MVRWSPSRRPPKYEAVMGEDGFSPSHDQRRPDPHAGIVAVSAPQARNPLYCVQRPERTGGFSARGRVLLEGLRYRLPTGGQGVARVPDRAAGGTVFKGAGNNSTLPFDKDARRNRSADKTGTFRLHRLR